MEPTRERGRVKWWHRLKGQGFILPDSGGQDVFIHYSGINGDERYKNLEEGQLVEYERVDEGKGPKAVNLEVVS